MKTAIIATAGIVAAAAIGIPDAAHADPVDQQFRSPSGNIVCSLIFVPPGPSVGAGGNVVQCDIGEHTWVDPQPPSPGCSPPQGETFILRKGGAPIVVCRRGSPDASALPALGYGQTRSAGTIRCDSETSAMTCTDTSTGHFFRISRESYEFG